VAIFTRPRTAAKRNASRRIGEHVAIFAQFLTESVALF